jgi:hypothetical protein
LRARIAPSTFLEAFLPYFRFPLLRRAAIVARSFRPFARPSNLSRLGADRPLGAPPLAPATAVKQTQFGVAAASG